jgi:5-methylcytosine-specific restriction enzyme A
MQYCVQPGCSVLVRRGRCLAHSLKRGYYTAPWRRLRQQVCLAQAYACADCGQVTHTLEVDHIRKHEGDPTLFWDRANLQALCSTCHTRKTLRGL